jgi:catechol 2,3-dioxygenase
MMNRTDAASDLATAYFRPRRLGHANIFVNDYERAQEFYYSVAGFHEAYRQPDNMASFVSNGNTYHDFGLTDIRSPYAASGQKAGLYHIAFELENEVALVAGYERLVADKVQFSHTRDHDVAHSVYIPDPDGNMVELYADVIRDWWTNRTGIIIKKKPKYVPGVTSVPVAERNYPVDPELRRVDAAVFHARRTTHVGFVAADFPAMFRFYRDVVGLTPFVGHEQAEFAVLRGTYGTGDVSLFRQRPEMNRGLHHVGVEVADEADLDGALARLANGDIPVERELDHPGRRAVTIRDPSGHRLQFYVNRRWQPEVVATVAPADALYLV